MITKETAEAIWVCYREIDAANKLLKDMEEVMAKEPDRTEPTLRDVFGRRRGLQLGVPSGENAHRLFDVPYDLSVKVIERHIEEKKKTLKQLEVKAKTEISTNDQ